MTLKNNGTYPRKDVRTTLAGRFREESRNEACGMPSWYRAFSGVYPKWKLHRRHAFAMSQIDRLTDYLETIQANYPEQLSFEDSSSGVGEGV